MPRPTRLLRVIGGHFRGTIISGLLILLPLGATYLIIKFVFDLIDPPLVQLIDGITGRHIPGVGIVSFIIVLYLVGLVGSYVIGRRLIAIGHSIANFIPIVRPIYRTAKQTVDALGPNNIEKHYSRVVLLDFPRRGVKSIGFATSTFKSPGGEYLVAVYIPTTPIPTSGYLALVPEDDVISTSLSVDEAMKIVISGGVLTPDEIEGMDEDEEIGNAALEEGRDGDQPEPPEPRRASNQ